MSENAILDRYVVIAEMIASMFFPFAETVVVDHRQKNPTIYAIFNNNITGRTKGFPTTDFGKLRLTQDIPDTLFNYANTGPKNQKLKSSAIAIRDEKNALIGVLAIHCELTSFLDFSSAISQFIQTNDAKPIANKKENFFFVESEDDIQKLIQLLTEKLKKQGKISLKLQRETIVKQLIDAKVFKQKKAISTVAQALNVSRPWIYSFLKSHSSSQE